VPTTATPLPAPTVTPTSTPTLPILSVSPTSITLTTCLAVTQTQFIVANTGGTSLSWTATGSGYQISPASGSLPAGGHETVTVSNILLSGSVTVSAPNAQHSPQGVSITCTV
jgi:hypothetical protein